MNKEKRCKKLLQVGHVDRFVNSIIIKLLLISLNTTTSGCLLMVEMIFTVLTLLKQQHSEKFVAEWDLYPHQCDTSAVLYDLIGLLQQTITWYMVVGKLIIIPALGHQNKGESSFTGSGLFVLMSQCGNNNALAHYHVPRDRLLQKACLSAFIFNRLSRTPLMNSSYLDQFKHKKVY